MSSLLQRFDDNVGEVRSYFQFLRIATEPNAELFRPDRKTHKNHRLSDQAQKMLKASSLLVLYNLVESTVCSALDAIYEGIKSEGASYEDLSDELRSIWIHCETSNLATGPAGIDKIRSNARKVVDSAVAGKDASIKHGYFPGSGNIDAKRIREIANQFGFSSRFPYEKRKTHSLLFVKSQRNQLAHGETTFGECGRDLVPSDLLKYEKEVVSYLRSMLKSVQVFIDRKQFLAVPA